MLNRVPKNFIAVIMKEKIGKNEYPDPLAFFWNDVQFCYSTDYRVTEIQKFFFENGENGWGVVYIRLKGNFMDSFAFYRLAKSDHEILHLRGLPP